MKKARAVASLSNMAGWKYLREYVESNLEPIEKDLLDNFDLSEEKRKCLQHERKAYNSILNFVDRRLEKIKNL